MKTGPSLKSRRRLVAGLLPKCGPDRIEPLPRGMTIRKLFGHKRYAALRARYVMFRCEQGHWHSEDTLRLGVQLG